MSATTKVILTTEEVITSILNVISATTKVILASEEVITVTLKIMSATAKVIFVTVLFFYHQIVYLIYFVTSKISTMKDCSSKDMFNNACV